MAGVDAERTGGTGDRNGRDDQPVVLAVDDEKRVTQAFELWLEDRYEVRTATSGEAALEQLDEDVDVVLLDRQMPGVSGDEVLARLRQAGHDARVAMVTGIDPDFDIVDMPFDDYVRKPVGREAVREVVDRLLSLSEYDRRLRQYYAAVEKRVALESEKAETELADSEAYKGLLAEIDRLGEDLDEFVHGADHDQVDALLRSLPERARE